MKRILVLWLLPVLLRGETGVLVPAGAEQPDPAVLSLKEMDVDISIDNGHAHVKVRQIFQNHTDAVQEGQYSFALPPGALVSDFAVWDDVTRIPGVILERRRAEEIYNLARDQAIDPGLLQAGERTADEARRTAVFSARIVPIPAYGNKRVEMEYQQRLAVEQLASVFSIPLRPDMYRAQTAGRLRISVGFRSARPVQGVSTVSKAYPLAIESQTPQLFAGTFEGRNVQLSEDFSLRWTFPPAMDKPEVLAFRDDSSEGFFEVSTILGREPEPSTGGGPRTVIALFDTSLSMQWEKLERSFLALERVLRSLRPVDHFNLIAFNSEVDRFRPIPLPATPQAVEQALAFVRARMLRGGTNLQAALEAAFAQAGPDRYICLFTDGGATEGADIQAARLNAWYSKRLAAIVPKPRTYILAVGDDANIPLLKLMARDNGVIEWIRSTEPPDYKIAAFISKIGRHPFESLSFRAEPAPNFEAIYPLHETVFGGADAPWVGRYKNPGLASFRVRGVRNGAPFESTASITLPGRALEHPHLPRTWAKARVDALLEKLDREGEDRASIDEIIRLSRKYKFVTPYTSFLAAPRSLLRPRLIRPGDPILRVRTDASVHSVVALFPFGLVKELRYLASEDIWQTRFLAPVDLADGTHSVRLLLTDRKGRVFRESKTFVIVSKPPVVRTRLPKSRYRRGERVHVRVEASQSARTILARFSGVSPVSLRWNAEAAASTGEFVVPAHLAAGRYSLRVTAEDFAHNIGSQEVSIEVVP